MLRGRQQPAARANVEACAPWPLLDDTDQVLQVVLVARRLLDGLAPVRRHLRRLLRQRQRVGARHVQQLLRGLGAEDGGALQEFREAHALAAGAAERPAARPVEGRPLGGKYRQRARLLASAGAVPSRRRRLPELIGHPPRRRHQRVGARGVRPHVGRAHVAAAEVG
eukprot:360572-Chlamydomonas_euryale.AAC.4